MYSYLYLQSRLRLFSTSLIIIIIIIVIIINNNKYTLYLKRVARNSYRN